MTEQRFDIVVQDKVARGIRTELTAIGASAKAAHADLARLNNALGAQTASAAARAQNAATRTAAATAKLNAEQARATVQTARMTAEQNKAALSAERVAQAEAKTALAKQRVATEAARTAEAQSRANIAYLREETALNRAVAAEARATQQKRALAAATDEATASQQRQIRIIDGNRPPPSSGTNYPFGRTAGSRKTTIPRDDPIVNPATARIITSNVAAIRGVGSASKLSAQYAAQLGFQVNDIAVGLATGQPIMTTFIQQGAQIAQLPAQAGMSWKEFGNRALNTLGIVKRTGDAALDAAAAQATAAAAAVASANSQAVANLAAAETEVALAVAQREAAVTADQQAAASTRLAAANQRLSAANAEAAVSARALSTAQGNAATANTAATAASTRSLTGLGRAGVYGAAALAVLAVTFGSLTREANNGETGLRHFTEEMGYTASEVEELNAVSVGFGDVMKATFQVAAKRILGIFGLEVDDMASAWNSALDWMASTTRAVMAGIYASVAGMAYGVKNIIENIDGESGNDNPLQNMIDGYKDAYADAQGFFDDVIAQSRANARARQDAMARDFGANPDTAGSRSRGNGFDRADEWRKVNEELDIQIGLLGKYGDELERAQQIEQIGRVFRENGQPLTATEVAQLDEKIQLLQHGRRVQEAMTAAEEAAHGPLRQLNIQEEALNNLLEQGVISMDEYLRQMNLFERAYEDATNPLAELNRELERNGQLMGLYGRDRDVAQYIQQLEQAAQARGETIFQSPPQTTGPNGEIVVSAFGDRRLTPEAQAMVDQFREQQRQGELASAFETIDPQQRRDPTDSSFILDNYREMYEEIARLREEDVIDEAEAARRKRNLDKAHLDAKLEYTSSILGQVSQLQDSKNKEVAALGKAAAIAQATIDGYRAVQAALAGPPGPPWSFAIAGVTAAMTAANVARIAGIGFQSGGFTGYGADNTVAGSVHRNEFVFDSAATNRIGVPALEAMRNGSLSQPSNDNMRGPSVVVKPQPGVYVEERRTSAGEIELIAARVARREAPKAVADDIKASPNGRVGKAMEQGYGVKRKR